MANSITFLSAGWVLAGDPLTLSSGNADVETGAGHPRLPDCGRHTPKARRRHPGHGRRSGSFTSITVIAGVVDLDGATVATDNVTLSGGSIVDGTLNVTSTLDLYSGMVSANITGPAALDKLGPDTVLLLGTNTNSGGDNALAGTLIAAFASSLPGPVSGPGTVVVQPTYMGPAAAIGPRPTGNWPMERPPPGSAAAAWSSPPAPNFSIDSTVDVSSITFQGNATLTGGLLSLPGFGTTIDVLAGTATVTSTIVGGGFTQGGAGTLVLDAPAACAVAATVDSGTLDALSPLASAPAVVGGQAIGPGTVFGNDGQSLYTLDPAMFALSRACLPVKASTART